MKNSGDGVLLKLGKENGNIRTGGRNEKKEDEGVGMGERFDFKGGGGG
jgi:hypothetical protein